MTDKAPPLRVTLAPREQFEPEFEEDAPPPEGLALPSGCLRRLTIDGHVCEVECAGVQRDGGCLAELVRGLSDWTMAVDQDGFWNVVG